MQHEERRLVNPEEISRLRAGLGESYQQSLIEILSASGGLLFRETVVALGERQGHPVHRGTVRALLSAGDFVQREGRWYPPGDLAPARRRLRRAMVETLQPADYIGTLEVPSGAHQLKVTAATIRDRLRELRGSG